MLIVKLRLQNSQLKWSDKSGDDVRIDLKNLAILLQILNKWRGNQYGKQD